jgi:hypothetical protein
MDGVIIKQTARKKKAAAYILAWFLVSFEAIRKKFHNRIC